MYIYVVMNFYLLLLLIIILIIIIMLLLPMVWKTGVQSQVESFQRLKKNGI